MHQKCAARVHGRHKGTTGEWRLRVHEGCRAGVYTRRGGGGGGACLVYLVLCADDVRGLTACRPAQISSQHNTCYFHEQHSTSTFITTCSRGSRCDNDHGDGCAPVYGQVCLVWGVGCLVCVVMTGVVWLGVVWRGVRCNGVV